MSGVMVPPPTPLVLEFVEHIFSVRPVTIELRQGVHFIGQIRDQRRIFITFGWAIAFYESQFQLLGFIGQQHISNERTAQDNDTAARFASH